MHNVLCPGSKGVLVSFIALPLILLLVAAPAASPAEDKVVTALYNAARLVIHYLLSEPGKAMVWEYQKVADAHPGANTPFTRAIAARGGRYIFETQDNYHQRAQLADKIRKAVIGQ